MKSQRLSKIQITWLVGDFIVLVLVTWVGLASHQMASAAGTRMWHNLLPWFAAWLLTAPAFGAFDLEKQSDARQLWRPFWAMVLASPMGGFLRGLWLGADVSPLFVIIFGGFAALGILAWRAAYWATAVRGKAHE